MLTRVVVDANIYASALMNAASTPAHVLRNVLEKQYYELVLSQPILEELNRILFYPKVRKRISRSDEDIAIFLHAISISAHQVTESYGYDVLVEEDPDDDIYLIAALDSGARYLVSGDRHLLKIGQMEKVKIITAAEFLKIERQPPYP